MKSDGSWRLDLNSAGEVSQDVSMEASDVDSFVNDLLDEARINRDSQDEEMPSANLMISTESGSRRLWLARSKTLQQGAFLRGVFCD